MSWRVFPISHFSVMKSITLLLSLLIGALSISCTTDLSDYNDRDAVSDAWLDTPPRTPQRPARPADGITHWNRGLPPAGAVKQAHVISKPSSVPARSKTNSGKQNDQQISTGHTGYHTGYTTHYIHGVHRGGHRHHHGRAQTGFVRTVEKVGPSIVPRLNVPETIRRAPTPPKTYHNSKNRRSNRGDHHTSNKGKNRGDHGGRRR